MELNTARKIVRTFTPSPLPPLRGNIDIRNGVVVEPICQTQNTPEEMVLVVLTRYKHFILKTTPQLHTKILYCRLKLEGTFLVWRLSAWNTTTCLHNTDRVCRQLPSPLKEERNCAAIVRQRWFVPPSHHTFIRNFQAFRLVVIKRGSSHTDTHENSWAEGK